MTLARKRSQRFLAGLKPSYCTADPIFNQTILQTTKVSTKMWEIIKLTSFPLF